MLSFKKPKISVLAIYILLLTIQSINLTSQVIKSHLQLGRNSDFLYPFAFWDDIFRSQVLQWNLTPSPYFFPDLSLYGIFYSLTKNGILSYYCTTISFVLLLFYSLYRFLDVFSIPEFQDDGWEETIYIKSDEMKIHISFLGLSFSLLFFSFLPEHFGIFFTLFFHGGIFLCLPLLRIFYAKETSHQTSFLFEYFFLLLIIPSDSHTILQFVFPILFLFPIFYLRYKQHFSFPVFFPIILILYLGIKKYIYKTAIWTIPKAPVLDTLITIFKSGKTFSNLQTGLQQLLTQNAGFGENTLFLIVWILVSSTVLARMFRSNLTIYEKYIFSVLGVSILFSMFLQFSLGVWIAPRYNWGLYLIPFWILPYLLYKWNQSYFFAIHGGFLFFLMLGIMVTYTGVYKNFPENKRINCIRDYAKQKKITAGISDYWNSKYITLFTKRELILNSFSSDLEPYIWITNQSNYNQKKYHFILLDGLSESKILEKWGEPKERFKCVTSELWFYPEGIQ
jgi:hypothetical protein